MRRREAFDEIADLYHEARPSYPESLVADLVELCRIDRAARVLEIGPGTGQLTRPIAERGGQITAIELGPRMADQARKRLADLGAVEIIVADFDRWTPPEHLYDVIVAATSFHWLDPRDRVRRCAAALKPGGKLAVIHTHWGIGNGADAFFHRSQTCYERWDPEHCAGFTQTRLDDLRKDLPEIADSALFALVDGRRYVVPRAYTTSQYSALLRTFSNIRGLAEDARSGLLTCIGRLIDEEFGGRIERTDAYELWVSERQA